MYIYIYVYKYSYGYICIYTCIYVYIYIHVYMSIYIYVYICISILFGLDGITLNPILLFVSKEIYWGRNNINSDPHEKNSIFLGHN